MPDINEVCTAAANAVSSIAGLRCKAKVRYRQADQDCIVTGLDDDKVEAELANKYGAAFVSVPSIGVGIGILGLAGVELRLPGLSMLSLFGEARYGYSAQFTQIEGAGDEDLEVDNLGGLGVHGGLRFSF